MGHGQLQRMMGKRKSRRRRLLCEALAKRELLAVDGATIENDEFEVRSGTASVTFDLLGNDSFDSDYDGERKISSTTFGSEGGFVQVAADGQSVQYWPPAEFFGTETFDYFVDFEHRGTVSVEIVSPLTPDVATVLPNGTAQRIDVLGNDQFWGLDEPAYQGQRRITAVSHSRLGAQIEITGDGTELSYTPAAHSSGKDTFLYFVDGIYPMRVDVSVTNPTGEDHVRDVIIDGQPRTIDVLSNDPFWEGYAGPREITHIFGGSSKLFSISEDGQRIELKSLTHAERGYHTITYVVDGTYEEQLSVQAHWPVRDDYERVYVNTYDNSIDVLLNDFIRYRDDRYSTQDPRGWVELDHADRITDVSEGTLGGEIQITGGGTRLLYTPPADHIGTEEFTYTVDGQYEARLRITTIFPPSGGGGGSGGTGGGSKLPNFRSTSCRPSADSITINQNDPQTEIDVLENDFIQGHYECDPYAGPRLITEITDPQNGVASISSDGMSISYTPDVDFVGSERISYVVDSVFTQHVSINVVRRVRDDQFRVAPDSTDNALNVTANDLFAADYRGPGYVTSVKTTNEGSQVSIADDQKSLVYTPPAGFVGQDELHYTVDGQLKAAVSIFVSPSKDELLGRKDPDVFWDAMLSEAIDKYQHLFGTEQLKAIFHTATAERASVVDTPRVFSETNVQVEGVDEADLIETDGEHLYVLRDSELIISDVWPADDLQILSRTQIEGTPIGIYWQGERIAVISEPVHYQPYHYDVASPFGFSDRIYAPVPQSRETIVTVVDVASPESPEVVHQTHLDGEYIQSRRIDESVFLVLKNDRVELPRPQAVCENGQVSESIFTVVGGKCYYESSEEYIERITPDLEKLLPNYESFDEQGNLIRSGLIVTPGDLYEPAGDKLRNLVTVASVNMQSTEPGIVDATAVLASGGEEIYASTESLYLVDQLDIGFSITRSPQSDDGETTRVLKFDWNGDTGSVDLAASGEIPGSVLNQFSMDEHNGYFRIATTLNNTYSGNHSGRSENTLWILEDNQGLLQSVGNLQNIGLEQQIKSVRFVGDRGFVTTFGETDPLLALDLSTPSNPARAGYVALPGYNGYMQPIDENHLLTIGHNGITESIGATQVLLFNIADITQPVIVGRHSFFLDSTSIAQQDHHAFGWFAHHGALAIPLVQNERGREDRDEDGYKEAPVFYRNDELAILEIDTDLAAGESGVRLRGTVENDSAVIRSAFIDNVGYSIAHGGITAFDINAPETIHDSVAIEDVSTPDDETQETGAIIERNGWARDQVPMARSKALDYFGNVATPPILVTMELGRHADSAAYVFQSGEKLALVRTGRDANETPVAKEFSFSNQRPRWQNENRPADVDGDDQISTRDALVVLNEINRGGIRAVPDAANRQIDSLDASFKYWYDVNGDSIISSIDALIPLNELHRESLAIASDTVFAAAGSDDDEDEFLDDDVWLISNI